MTKLNQNLNKESNNREIGLDIVKTIAILFVISVHFFLNTRYYKTNLENSNLFLQTMFQQLFLSCIPLFLMATGYLNNATKINMPYFKKIIPILSAYLIYSIPALAYRAHIGEITYDIPLWIEQIFTFKGHRYSWYINMYFGLFLLIPFLNRLYNSLSEKKEKQSLICILILLTIIGHFVPNYWAKMYPLTYFFIGKYIREYQPRMNNVKALILIVVILLTEATVEFLVAKGGVNTTYFNHYASFFRLTQSYLIFLIAYKINTSNKTINKIISNISALTLDIYLASFLTDRLTYKYFKGFNLNQESIFVLFIPIVLISFISAWIIAIVRNKLIKLNRSTVK